MEQLEKTKITLKVIGEIYASSPEEVVQNADSLFSTIIVVTAWYINQSNLRRIYEYALEPAIIKGLLGVTPEGGKK